jgi:hypothetical protein
VKGVYLFFSRRVVLFLFHAKAKRLLDIILKARDLPIFTDWVTVFSFTLEDSKYSFFARKDSKFSFLLEVTARYSCFARKYSMLRSA